jgi:hypothetical protein
MARDMLSQPDGQVLQTKIEVGRPHRDSEHLPAGVVAAVGQDMKSQSKWADAGFQAYRLLADRQWSITLDKRRLTRDYRRRLT